VGRATEEEIVGKEKEGSECNKKENKKPCGNVSKEGRGWRGHLDARGVRSGVNRG
jgi:hypothetical protein